jgi:AcrR family transcriptional regulator
MSKSAAPQMAPSPTSETQVDARPLRRDAELNLSRILTAARDVFAQLGYDASMEQIAARADVGVGTLYRRFPNKADLLEAVVDAAKDQTKTIAEEVLAQMPAGDAVFEFVRRCVAVPSCWRATITRPPWSVKNAGFALTELAPLFQQILGRSQDAGTIRRDIELTDLVVTLVSVRAVADLCDARAPGSSRRFLELALDGLRPGNPAPSHPPMTTRTLGDVLAGR